MGLRKGCAIAAKAMFGVLFVLLSGNVLAQAADTIVNWGASANGGVATVSSTASSTDYPATSLNDGEPLGLTWGHGDGWRSAGTSKSGDWAQITLADRQTIHAVTVYSAPDGVVLDAEDIDNRSFSRVGVVDFDVQISNGKGNDWKTIAHVSGNHLIKRSVAFAPVSAGAVRIVGNTGGTDGVGVVEIEIWGATRIDNVAAANAHAVATVDSTYGPLFPASALNDGVTDGKNWGAAPDGGWMNGSSDPFPNHVDIAFPAIQVINTVTVWTLQDDYEHASAPGESTQFSKDGLTDFDVQVLNNGWTTVASITGNSLVKRTVTFPPIATSYLRIVNKAGLNSYARIVEVQAWGIAAAGVPFLTGMEPRSGQVGDTVTLRGVNFSAIATANAVTFNGTPAKIATASNGTWIYK